MSLYREAGRSRRAIAIAAILALVAGLSAGFAIGRATAPETTLADNLDDLRADLRPAMAALELVTIEYPQAVDGEGVIAETEYQATISHAEQAEASFEAVAERLRSLDPQQADVVAAKLEALRLAIEAAQKPRLVEAAANKVRRMLEALIVPPGGV